MSEKENVIEPIKNECPHTSGWGRLGTHALNSADGNVFIVGIVFCKKCGSNKVQIHKIESEKKSEVAQPEVVLPPVETPAKPEAN